MDVLSNILQHNDINNLMISKSDRSTTHVFYIKGKFSKLPSNWPPLHGCQHSYPRATSYSRNNSSFASSSNSSSNKIICHYYGISGHKALDCRKKKRNQTLLVGQSSGESRPHTNNFMKEEGPLYLFTTITINPGTSPCWFLYFGASQHMTPNQSFFHHFQNLPKSKTIVLGNNSSYQATGFGIVQIQLSTGQCLFIQNVLYISSLAKNLLSIAQITTTGHTILFF